MPHYGLMDPINMSEEDAALMRARLYLHDGKRLIEEGLSTAAIATLYDALLFAMRYYTTRPQKCKFIDLTGNQDLWDYAALYHTLTKAGVFEDPYAFNQLSLIVERVLWQKSFSFDAGAVFAEVEGMLTRLGVMPFDEVSLTRVALATH
jgi:hypothetical protein